MKSSFFVIPGMVILVLISPCEMKAQDQESGSNVDVTLDIVSNYVWRGTRYGQGVHFQPGLSFSKGGLTLGVWGSTDMNGYAEADPYLSFSFPFGMSLGITDYYYPGLPFFDVSAAEGSHAFELNLGYEIKKFSLSANYIMNEAGYAGSAGGDVYLQAGYSFGAVSLVAGAGNGWHTLEGGFNLCNLGVSAVKTIEVTEKFSFSLTGQAVFNPDREQFYLVGMISL